MNPNTNADLIAAIIEKVGQLDPGDARDLVRTVLAGGHVESGIDIYLPPWPDGDRAADMLAAWRSAPGSGPVRVNIFEVA
jgi:hypothetical protein